IVEVMISMSILAVVLSGAYATSHRSLQSGLNSQYQDQALSYARAQIELIKNADNNQPVSVGSYKLNRPFCINPATTAVQEVDSASKACPLPIGQTDPNNQLPYTIVNNYDSTSKSFTSTVSWLSSNGVPSAVTLRYKAHDSFVTTASSFPPPPSPPITPPPAVGVSLSANPPSVAYSGTSQLSWSSTGATGCTASGTWSGPRATTSPPGGEQVGPLTSTSNAFYLACTNGGSTTQKQVTVAAAAPPAPSLDFLADTTYVTPGGSTTLRWTASNVPGTCSATGSWSGNRNSSGNEPTGAISRITTSYTLTCHGYAGTTPASKTVTIQSTLSVRLNVSSNSIRNHSPLTLSWSAPGASSCVAGSSWSGNKPVSGSETINPINLSLSGNSQSFYLTCFGPGGSVTDHQTVYVGPAGLVARYYQGSNFESFQGAY
ncbi:hypothetical protein BVY00_02215, partial [bacterium G20]